MSNIKDRVLMIASSRKINKVDFFKDLGLSYANFKGAQKQSSLGSEAVATILSKYNDISPEWLVTGEGEMQRDTLRVNERPETYLHAELEGISNAVIHSMQQVISAQEVTIKSQEKTIYSLDKQIVILEHEIEKLKKN